MKSMIRALAALGAALVFAGCGSPNQPPSTMVFDGDYNDWRPETAALAADTDQGADPVADNDFVPVPDDELLSQVSEFGQVAEALTLPSGFGSDEAQQPCSSASIFCWHPYSRNWLVYGSQFFPTNCRTSFVSLYQQAYQTAATFWTNQMNAYGWKTSINPAVIPPDTRNAWVQVQVTCRNDTSGIYIAQTSLSEDHDNGHDIWFNQSTIKLDPADIERSSPWLTATPTLRKNFLFNVIAHEMGHAIGFGHARCSGATPGTTLMGSANCGSENDVNSPAWKNAQSISSAESFMMRDYRP